MAKKTSAKPALPPYLGFGVLGATEQHGETSANYMLGDEVVYRVMLTETNCRITEYFNDKEFATAIGAKLDETFFQLFAAHLPYTHPRFERLYHQICDQRNIYIEFPHESRYLFFPAGYIFVLRQPIVHDTLAIWKKLEPKLARQKDSGPIQIHAKHSGIIFRLLKSGDIRGEDVSLVDFSALLVNLASAADWLWQNKLVPSEHDYRLVIKEAMQYDRDVLRVYLGGSLPEILTHSVFVKHGNATPLDQVAQDFANGSVELLKRVQK